MAGFSLSSCHFMFIHCVIRPNRIEFEIPLYRRRRRWVAFSVLNSLFPFQSLLSIYCESRCGATRPDVSTRRKSRHQRVR